MAEQTSTDSKLDTVADVEALHFSETDMCLICDGSMRRWGTNCPHCGSRYEFNEGNVLDAEWVRAEFERLKRGNENS